MVPGFRRLLGTAPLNLIDLLVVGLGVLGPYVLNEMTKPPMPPDLGQDGERATLDAVVESHSQEQEKVA